ncbi:MAG: GNAT family N-acetyltransferase [Lachnospiraceae bacterium]|nr:GNAT family N-acetyltransferase [Lachnospiraceae bacterium]
MQLLFGKEEDIEQWMALVRGIRWNFPGLETEESLLAHRETVLRFMAKKQALCVKTEEEIVGVLLFSYGRNMICCLGVSPRYRRCKVASMLLQEALKNLDPTKDITVSTFREEDEKGTAPRALYKKFGFEEDELIEEFGYPNQRFVLRAEK